LRYVRCFKELAGYHLTCAAGNIFMRISICNVSLMDRTMRGADPAYIIEHFQFAEAMQTSDNAAHLTEL
jgi:hypothetical protein